MEIEITDSDDVFGHWETTAIGQDFPNVPWGDEPRVQINSKIFAPVNYQAVAETFTIKGTAWSGNVPLRRVDIGIHADGAGANDLVWTQASITPPSSITELERPDYDDSDGSAFTEAAGRVTSEDEPVPFVWSLWQAEISLPTDARFHRIFARATDAAGNEQPFEVVPPNHASGTNEVHSLLVQRQDG